MKIISYIKSGIKHILAIEDSKEEIDLEDFLFETAGSYAALEILFIESLVLPATIIDALTQLIDQYGERKLSIYTTTETLSYYLTELSIPNKQINANEQVDIAKYLNVDYCITQEELQNFLTSIFKVYGYDFQYYQKESMERTISRVMQKFSFANIASFQKELLKDKALFRQFFQDVSINVTDFFRNPDMYKLLREEIFPYLDSFPHIRIWSAGSSTGAEAYSIAIILEELNMLHKSIIYATDYNATVLQKAQNGLYSLTKRDALKESYQKSGGTGDVTQYFTENKFFLKFSPRLKEKVVFFRHNLTTDSAFNEFQLILCKNVFIYFNKELQEKTLDMFSTSLHRNGFLVLGKSENPLVHDKEDIFKRYKQGFNIFKRRV